MNFNQLSTYKEKVLSKLLASGEIREALSTSVENPEASLLYHNIYPYLYIPDVLTEEKAFICMDCTVPRLETGTTKEVNIILYIYSHKNAISMLKDGYNGTRIDYLMEKTDQLLADSKDFGIGRVRLLKTSRFHCEKTYYGQILIYTFSDFTAN